MEAGFHHYLEPDEPDPSPDGRRVLITQYPFVLRIWRDENKEDRVCKASRRRPYTYGKSRVS